MYTQSHTVVQGGRWNSSLEFLICCSISKRFNLQWKAFGLFYKMRYNLWMVALLENRNATKHGHHLGRHVGFNQDLAVR